MKCYYAHCMAIYNTQRERLDIEILEKLGFDVVNPNSQKHKYQHMSYYTELTASCDCLAYRATQDGKITSGVMLEIEAMQEANKPVIELPYVQCKKKLNRKQTVEYIRGLTR